MSMGIREHETSGKVYWFQGGWNSCTTSSIDDAGSTNAAFSPSSWSNLFSAFQRVKSVVRNLECVLLSFLDHECIYQCDHRCLRGVIPDELKVISIIGIRYPVSIHDAPNVCINNAPRTSVAQFQPPNHHLSHVPVLILLQPSELLRERVFGPRWILAGLFLSNQ
ncbi:hypothetical protein BT96DRAFT_552294 [Gymnopus androsaceus JB14]|uniref:Uncharacterized protein n=1 Tax=Gymnopus androsaceus JB14 TaxID=1447944 RepID=A0A6A4HV77_9AGAR|nr:hypothetical protein BT96DRAFT_552294 [Gymnopus androsaceus JB14]